MKISLRHQDSRDIHGHIVFGQAAEIPAVSNLSVGMQQIIEPVGSVACTMISDVKVGSVQSKNNYDYVDLENNTPHTSSGADPRTTLGEMISKGLLRLNSLIRDVLWKSYVRCDTGTLADAFQNTQSIMTLCQSPCTACTVWYAEWNFVQPNGIMPSGVTPVSDHDWVIKDWDANGNFIIDAHQGYDMLMPRSVFNTEIGRAGCGTYMPLTSGIQATVRITLAQWFDDLLVNLLIWLETMTAEFK